MRRPEQGTTIGAARKLRWAREGSGKRGGIRVIYFWAPREAAFHLLYAYAKNEQGDLTPGQAKALAGAHSGGIHVKSEAFQELLTSVRQAGRIRRGAMRASRVTTFKPADIKAVRRKLRVSQSEFALMIGVNVSTLRNWEQGRRVPDGPALALLRVASKNPVAVAQALHGWRGAA